MRLEPPPRRIKPGVARAIRKDRKLLAVASVILIAAGIGLAVLFSFLIVPRALKELDVTGILANGTVESMVERRNVQYGSVHPWEISYRFETESGEVQRGRTETTDLDFVRARKVGDSVTIAYDPANPALSKILGVGVAGLQEWFFFIPAGELAIGLVLLAFRSARVSAALAVYEQGTERQGRILHAKVLRSVNMWRRHPVSVRYSFEDEMGLRRFGKTWSWHPKARELKEGQECSVLYDRVNTSRSVLYDTLELYLE